MASLSLKATRVAFKLLSVTSPSLSVRLAEQLFSTPRTRPLSKTEQAVLADGEALPLTSGLAATRWGSSDAPKVLLVHGWQRHRASLRDFVNPLVKAGKQVIAFDAPAHNDSPGRTANPIIYAEALLELGRELGPLHGVVAHSMGGGATVLALHDGLQAERVVLLAPASDWEYQLRFFTGYLGLNEAMSDRFVRRLEAQARSLDRMTPAYLCKELEQPFLLFHDMEDQRVPYQDSTDLAKHLPVAELVTLRELGHSKLLYDAEVVAKTVNFLR